MGATQVTNPMVLVAQMEVMAPVAVLVLTDLAETMILTVMEVMVMAMAMTLMETEATALEMVVMETPLGTILATVTAPMEETVLAEMVMAQVATLRVLVTAPEIGLGPTERTQIARTKTETSFIRVIFGRAGLLDALAFRWVPWFLLRSELPCLP